MSAEFVQSKASKHSDVVPTTLKKRSLERKKENSRNGSLRQCRQQNQQICDNTMTFTIFGYDRQKSMPALPAIEIQRLLFADVFGWQPSKIALAGGSANPLQLVAWRQKRL